MKCLPVIILTTVLCFVSGCKPDEVVGQPNSQATPVATESGVSKIGELALDVPYEGDVNFWPVRLVFAGDSASISRCIPQRSSSASYLLITPVGPVLASDERWTTTGKEELLTDDARSRLRQLDQFTGMRFFTVNTEQQSQALSSTDGVSLGGDLLGQQLIFVSDEVWNRFVKGKSGDMVEILRHAPLKIEGSTVTIDARSLATDGIANILGFKGGLLVLAIENGGATLRDVETNAIFKRLP